MKRQLVGTLVALAALLHVAPAASADPLEPSCFDDRLCGDLGSVSYCPDTGTMVGPFAACSGLVTGPYAPGGLSPNED
ncbi:hypothetical protein KIH27_14225 [Mycobacterium sp. M1]|uniref:Uncharacterized protein n=1 Tax=Mycolicibacter acidiphilus TaxID=2835306 RepID=A0ABS5RL78_9MYCO|nr:hypothetical protein [Mycolicibacter acidiphilus]MBS9534747.1 hypothetical protein [Mycolicibacter acidiphilus]